MYRPTFLSSANSVTHEAVDDMAMDVAGLTRNLCATYQTTTLADAFLAAAISGWDEAIDDMRVMLNILQMDVNYQDPVRGLTALHGAISYGHLSMVRFLLHECVAEINIQDHNGNFALDRVENLDPITRVAIVNEYIRVSRIETPEENPPRRREEFRSTHKNGVHIHGRRC